MYPAPSITRHSPTDLPQHSPGPLHPRGAYKDACYGGRFCSLVRPLPAVYDAHPRGWGRRGGRRVRCLLLDDPGQQVCGSGRPETLTGGPPDRPPPTLLLIPASSPEWGPQHLKPCKGTMQTRAPLSRRVCLPRLLTAAHTLLRGRDTPRSVAGVG